MAVWVVTSSGMAVEVDAYKASTSPAGVLVFTDSQGDLVRATSGSKDDLQAAMRLLDAQDFDFVLKYTNYR